MTNRKNCFFRRMTNTEKHIWTGKFNFKFKKMSKMAMNT